MDKPELISIVRYNTHHSSYCEAILTAVDKYVEARIADSQCSTLREFVAQMHSHVMKMKSRAGLSDGDERYISGQELICSLVLQEIDKLQPAPVA